MPLGMDLKSLSTGSASCSISLLPVCTENVVSQLAAPASVKESCSEIVSCNKLLLLSVAFGHNIL